MNFWEKLGFKKRSFTDAYAPVMPYNLIADTAGKAVNGNSAMSVPPYAAAVTLMSTSLAKLSLHIEKEGKRVEDNSIYELLKNPSQLYDRFTLFQQAELNALNEGNGFILIERNADKTPKQLLLVNPAFVSIIFQGGKYEYQVTPANGEMMKVKPEDMIHVKTPYLDYDAVKGVPYHKVLEKQLGLWLASQDYQNKYFSMGSNPLAVIEVDEKLSKEKREMVRESWEQMSAGDNKHRVAIVDAGMRHKNLGFNFQELEMQHIYDSITKQIASVFNIQPVMIGQDGSKNTYANTETQNMQFLQQALLPRIIAFEAQLSKLFPQGSGLTAKFNYESLLRADSKSRAERLKLLVESEIMTKDEARQIEGLQ